MAAAQDKQNTDRQRSTEESSITLKLNDFIQKNRKIILMSFAVFFVLLIGFIIVQTVRDKVQSKAFSQMNELERRFEMMKYSIQDEMPDETSVAEDLEGLLEDLQTFARKNSGFAAARAHYVTADIYSSQKRWDLAEKAWTEAARISSKSYLAPIAIFNAAVAAEEQGNIDTAIQLYTRAMNYGNSFFASARAQFTIGRLEESRNNKEAAIEAYRNLVNKWPADPHWTSLAQSRIIVLSNL